MIGSPALTRSFRPMVRAGVALFAILTMPLSAEAEQRFIVRTPNLLGSGADAVASVCAVAGCTVRYPVDGALQQVFLVTTADGINPQTFVATLSSFPVVANAEIDLVVQTLANDASQGPAGLYNRDPIAFYGGPVWRGYAEQPAAGRVRIQEAQSATGLTGRFVKVAVIDTGVDPQHPVLQPFLVGGYDFTRDVVGGSERADLMDGSLDQSTMAVVDQDAQPALVNQSTMAVVDQSTMAVVDNPAHPAFGHGTMVAGVVHLVAPEASIMPLKAFGSDGRGYSSDILRSIYYAVYHDAKVLNMSFSYAAPSAELGEAVRFAMSRRVLVIASAGNNGQHAAAYPAAVANVIGVASTNDADAISAFSNYGEDLFWVAAPGEAVITTYPFATYAAAWGTSFSAPFAAGTAALLAQMTPSITQDEARSAIGQALPIAGVACGRLDVMGAVSGGGSPIPYQP